MASSDHRLELLRLSADDNVAVALRPLAAGGTPTLDGSRIAIAQVVAFGDTVAACPIGADATIGEFDRPIGPATRDIAPGQCVHAHEVASDCLPAHTLPE